jgi:hypothetical protein
MRAAQVTILFKYGYTATYTYCKGYLHTTDLLGVPWDVAFKIPITRYDLWEHQRGGSLAIIERMFDAIEEGNLYPKEAL